MAITHEDLAHFWGTENYYGFSPLLFPKLYLTDGTKYLAENAGAYWLMDLIGSYLPRIKKAGFGSVKLVVRAEEARVTIDDGNGNVIAKQRIGYTDFPLGDITLYVTQEENDSWIIMLTSEY